MIANRYISTRPALISTPPIISLNQCTPEINLPNTIKIINNAIADEIHRLIVTDFILEFNCIMAVGITHKTSIVVDDGYEASR